MHRTQIKGEAPPA